MIRPTTIEDAPLLVELAQATGMFKPFEIQALREVFDDYFKQNQGLGHKSFTLEQGGRLDGFVYFAPTAMTEGTWHLWWIAVRKDQQARGLGAELLRFAEEDIRSHGGRRLFIETSSKPHYEKTRQFYLKHGYEAHALLQDYYGEGDCMVVFRKTLNAEDAENAEK
ncbi:MAG: GNAT family N-acetyltransferase [Gemmataceae bacterium]|nr:GNAT family N-acetyltransferase [Gemmataceae bacterium]